MVKECGIVAGFADLVIIEERHFVEPNQKRYRSIFREAAQESV